MRKAILFDLDGTIADTIPAICEGINRTMRKRGYPEHTEKEILGFINHGARELIRRAMPEELRDNDALVDEVLSEYDREYSGVFHITDRTYEGMAELIAELHATGYAIGILSNKQDRFVKELAERILLPDSWDVAQGVIPGKPTKPHPYLATLVCEALGVSPSQCVVVGDSHVDIDTAKNASMAHIGVSWGFRDEEFLRSHGATQIAHTPAELLEIIEAMRA